MTQLAPGQATPRRWEYAVDHRGTDVRWFVESYWKTSSRHAMLIAGAGFDPRARYFAELLGASMGDRLTALFIREERASPREALLQLAEANLRRMQAAVTSHNMAAISIFAHDSAVVGGREVARLVNDLSLDGIDDVIIDFSALSIGTSFPLTRVILDRVASTAGNVHAVVVADPALDAKITPVPAETASAVHGFQGRWRLDETAESAKLWLPHLAAKHQLMLDLIHREVAPHDVCPILPFPADDPRAGDILVTEYLTELQVAWDVDARNVIHADEGDPLDVYRTILQLDDARRPVFEQLDGSLSILSPVGSKVLALGALLAAIERNFPVVHVEAVDFTTDAAVLSDWAASGWRPVHVWLTGEAYSALPPV